MLVAALRSDNPLGGAPLACDAAAEHFTIHGIGEITAAKLLDLENRRQLVWADPVTREWVLETVALRVRRATAAKAAARAAAAAAAASAAAASAAAASAREQARAGDIARAGAGTLVFEPPPPAGARHPAGVRAARTRFETPVAVGDGPRRVVWSESSTAARHRAEHRYAGDHHARSSPGHPSRRPAALAQGRRTPQSAGLDAAGRRSGGRRAAGARCVGSGRVAHRRPRRLLGGTCFGVRPGRAVRPGRDTEGRGDEQHGPPRGHAVERDRRGRPSC